MTASWGVPPQPWSWQLREPARNGLGIAGLVFSISGLVLWLIAFAGLPLSAAGVICGAVARRQARRGTATNGGMALAAIIVGAIGVLVSAIWLAVIIYLVLHPDLLNEAESGGSR
ncbi:DUF4190 domain-containing protein [Streptomyces sp. A7024]|uniref:DUF4190 domain-containing protein n=1 Tax=Streptomyces coryli TaxID=1128680 RepID=A0A6G4TYZ2_9ACTN|nr:DUF4190 domain-containing protein [Streptomyces coryli]NGN64740.1 DUF4190 domain-containing protein [Streptomyces coryli]